MNSSLQRNRAFTLIELLIVITIIGILAIALIPRLTGGPARARDAQRMTDLKQIATALEQQYQDNGTYPFYEGCVSTNTDLSNYLAVVPVDPKTDGTGGTDTSEVSYGECSSGYGYVGLQGTGTLGSSYTPGGAGSTSAKGYLLTADLETETTRTTGVYSVYNTGATTFTVTTTRNAATNFSNNGAINKVCSTSGSCATSTNVIYLIGH